MDKGLTEYLKLLKDNDCTLLVSLKDDLKQGELAIVSSAVITFIKKKQQESGYYLHTTSGEIIYFYDFRVLSVDDTITKLPSATLFRHLNPFKKE